MKYFKTPGRRTLWCILIFQNFKSIFKFLRTNFKLKLECIKNWNFYILAQGSHSHNFIIFHSHSKKFTISCFENFYLTLSAKYYSDKDLITGVGWVCHKILIDIHFHDDHDHFNIMRFFTYTQSHGVGDQKEFFTSASEAEKFFKDFCFN